MRKRIPTYLVGAVIILASTIVLGYIFWPQHDSDGSVDRPVTESEQGETVTPVDAAVMTKNSFPIRVEATGRLRAFRSTTLSMEASGVVVRRAVTEGDYVSKGTLLVVLDDRDERIALAEAEAELLKARSEYAVEISHSGSNATADTTNLAQLRDKLQTMEQAFLEGSITQRELTSIRRQFEAASVLSGQQRDEIQAVTKGLTQAEQAYERARLQLDRTRLVAPFAGSVSDIKFEVGQHVNAGEELMQLRDYRTMKADVDVLESNMVNLRRGAEAIVRVPALDDREFTGTIDSINPVVNENTGTGRVTVIIPNADRRLISGLYAYIELEADRLDDRLFLPEDAVLVRQGRNLVFVIEHGTAKWTYIETGIRSGDMVEVVSGIAEGDTVSIDGHFALAHDARVEVKSLIEY